MKTLIIAGAGRLPAALNFHFITDARVAHVAIRQVLAYERIATI